MQINVALCDLTELPVDAVVNPANSLGLMAQGVGAALVKRGGRTIEEEARSSAPVAVGAAVVTTGGSLYAANVIHAPIVEEPGERPSIENVRRATRAALIAAAARNLNTIGLPTMSDGAEGVPDDEAARAMVDELRAHKPSIPSVVYLVATRNETIYAFEEALRNASNPG
jgi:O-acetyl-ADP-ribose deacetylase (regulator of RNase III)